MLALARVGITAPGVGTIGSTATRRASRRRTILVVCAWACENGWLFWCKHVLYLGHDTGTVQSGTLIDRWRWTLGWRWRGQWVQPRREVMRRYRGSAAK